MAKADVPKGCIPVSVGHGEEEQRRRFLVPVDYLNHPMFARLLKEAEEEYGFDQKGLINIPCHVHDFQMVWESIDSDSEPSNHHRHKCFRVN
ncbi:hypothetical protein MLD38_019885 [Melastoma candidum]|uniref:Uncharacterized protein n=1 Tax=Melastoma candidum TaxID=119954 RepID=A0ACB9QJ61_9MYRT|nr:hypothetical protein MLD38_019885 [Melastoma candidum]